MCAALHALSRKRSVRGNATGIGFGCGQAARRCPRREFAAERMNSARAALILRRQIPCVRSELVGAVLQAQCRVGERAAQIGAGGDGEPGSRRAWSQKRSGCGTVHLNRMLVVRCPWGPSSDLS